MLQVTPILSMLHEPADVNSATRRFRALPVLNWTLRRLAPVDPLQPPAILCWEDQAPAVSRAIENTSGVLCVRGPRRAIAALDTVAASRRWSDGWRGGLLAACEFDRGFYGPFVDEIRRQRQTDWVLLVDPASGLLDPVLIQGLLAQARKHTDLDLCFSQAAPGLSGVLIRTPLLEQLAAKPTHPGIMLCYHPDAPHRDPIADPACAPIPVPLARTTRRFSLDSARQIARLSGATAGLNGQLLASDALQLLKLLEAGDAPDQRPRELVMELTTDRLAHPIYRAGAHRPPMELETAGRLLAELAEADDARLVLAGAGDPLLHGQALAVIEMARAANIAAICVESDFVGVPEDRIGALAESAVDIVSVHLPAASAATYQTVMGVDRLADALGQIRLFAARRAAHGRGLPLLVPTFVKCRQNLPEMEPWYDHWLRTFGCAVLAGPSDFGGMIPDVGVADMSGPNRRPCVSLSTRLMALSDGTIVSCEQDVLGRQPLGKNLADAWNAAGEIRRDHLARQWNKHPVCAGCKEWHRS
jgi:hypothetical protein